MKTLFLLLFLDECLEWNVLHIANEIIIVYSDVELFGRHTVYMTYHYCFVAGRLLSKGTIPFKLFKTLVSYPSIELCL